MNKLNMESANIIENNLEYIKDRFPNVIVETRKGLEIDFNMLKQELSSIIADDSKEKYQLTWPGKKESILLANTPTSKTLRPLKEKSVDFDNTENIYIEGDNLDVLKILQESYLNKIKCIYIDPPYNTGRNLIYKNDYSKNTKDEYLDSGQISESGNRMVVNLESCGKFHSEWLSMMYSRIKLSRNLLDKDGIIVIAIDDNEFDNLKKITNEVFGENNFIGTIVTRSNPQGRAKKNIDPTHEYHLIYSKSYEDMNDLTLKRKKTKNEYTNFIRGGNNSSKNERPRRYYPMLVKDQKVSCIDKSEYSKIYNEKTGFDENYIKIITKKYTEKGYLVVYPLNNSGDEKVWQRQFDRVVNECDTYIYVNGQIKTPNSEHRTPMSTWFDDIHSNVAYGANVLKSLFDGQKLFDYSKSYLTVKDLISLSVPGIIIDFFSGSATTAHAVMQLNAEGEEKRNYIMVQTRENQEVSEETKKSGYNSICEIGQERIRRAAKKIKEETNADIDYGFRVYNVDSSNMKDIYYKPEDFKQENLTLFQDNIKEDRSELDLLTQVILDLGLTLDLNIEEKRIKDNKVYFVADNSLVACFDDYVDISIVDEICKINPLKVVFKDQAFRNDSDKINLQERIKKHSLEIEISIL